MIAREGSDISRVSTRTKNQRLLFSLLKNVSLFVTTPQESLHIGHTYNAKDGPPLALIHPHIQKTLTRVRVQ